MFAKRLGALALLLGSCAWAQTTAIEGDVKDENGQLVAKGIQVRIERTDIKGLYKTKTDKKGHYFHAGLPLGTYNVFLEMDGKDADAVKGVRPRLGDPTPVNFDLSGTKKQQQALQKSMENGELTKEQERGMSKEQKAALDKQMAERSASMKKNKELNDAFNGGRQALTAANDPQAKKEDREKSLATAVEQFNKAAEMDPKQHVIWGQLAEAYSQMASLVPPTQAADQTAAFEKAFGAYNKAIELNPADSAYLNNYGLALAKAKKYDEAKAQLQKAATLEPAKAGQFYYNLGAIYVNSGQTTPAEDMFKQAIESDANYADAHYQYGVCLIARATNSPDGKMIPVPGTKEAFEKYLELKPDGSNAEASKGMLAAIGATIETKFDNPDAKKNQQKKTAPKKK